ncbi:hypothetical protein L249_4203 [Ophiocordyceps polyrhachis-furcata BCC 54312]|uniref:ELMO domain-containing protein n=1 Tax=Ophiocordyceps polyrhachis-furcata BCC 54312 TaxID=1330021 RepID=A0A367LBV5_9HYPO|nr:hypothetical protein L249_4203 [Ophiocordyceps polyrhachis-furcata BCC 54312]
MDQADIPDLLSRLSSDQDAVRKMAVFKLQNSISDPAFADVFISAGGLVLLRRLIMTSGGNTLAYSLQSLTRLLEVDMGWDMFQGPLATDLVERAVELIVTNPLVNILRGAMAILVALVGHSESGASASFGFRALKPAVAVHPRFFELVVQQLQSADHALCANALMLINALMRDALAATPSPADTGAEDWTKLVRRLQDLGLVQTVYKLMQSSALHDLALPLVEFQSLTRALTSRWRRLPVDLERPEHRRSLKSIHLASVAPGQQQQQELNATAAAATTATKDSRRHNADKWRRLGFETENPARDFHSTGYLGLMDLADYARKHGDAFQKLLLEQTVRPEEERCPVARASICVTAMLCRHFDVDKADPADKAARAATDAKNQEELLRPPLLQWSRLHAVGLQSFLRIWKATGARQDDLDKVAEVVRILLEQVVGGAGRTRSILEIEDEMLEYDLDRLREAQMGLLEAAFEGAWGQHLHRVREVLRREALQFVKEQRVRCLLEGSWFAVREQPGADSSSSTPSDARGWRFARLSHNRRYLHYGDFEVQAPAHEAPGLDGLTERLDLGTISSVVSNVTMSMTSEDGKSTVSNRSTAAQKGKAAATTKITIYGEQTTLTLWPESQSLASEWLDGLLLLLNQAPITAETTKLVDLVSDYGLRMRLLNVRMDTAFAGPPAGAGVVPSREGLDEDYFFEV